MRAVGNITYNSEKFELSIKNTVIKLEPKVGALLGFLLEHKNETLSKDQIIATIWGGVVVSDNALERVISQLRSILKSEQDYINIQTIRKRGYCLQIYQSKLPGDSLEKNRKSMLIAVSAVLMMLLVLAIIFFSSNSHDKQNPPVFSIAVLPFDDLSEQRDQAYLSDGLTEEIIHLLAGIDGTRVASRTSSMAYKYNQFNMRRIAEELNVVHVLEGSVRKSGNNVRVTVQLIDAKNDVHLWSHTYDREMSELLTLQKEIAYEAVNSLRRMFNLQPYDTSMLKQSNTVAGDAYDNFLHGKQLFQKISRLRLKKAIAYGEDAVRASPDFTRAWELLGSLYLTAVRWEWDDKNYLYLAQKAIAKLQTIEPDSSAVNSLKGIMLTFEHDWVGALAHLNRAIEIAPNNSEYFLVRGLFWHQTGFLAQAEADFDRCLSLEPLSGICLKRKALSLHLRGKEEAAIRYFFEAEELGFDLLKSRLSPLLVRNGHRYAVLLHLKLMFFVFERIEDFPYTAMLDQFGNKAIPEKTRARLIALTLTKSPSATEPMLVALGAYEHVRINHAAEGLWYPEFPQFYESDRFQQLIKEMQLVNFWREFQFPRQCTELQNATIHCDLTRAF